jgi:hypothetical protein
MAADTIHKPPTTIDLTGLPEPVVREVHRLVQQARQQLAEKDGTTANGVPKTSAVVYPQFISDPRPTPDQFGRLLDEMAAMGTGKALPPDFSRADIYDDHD